MAVIVSPPPPKKDIKFDDWMYLFWKSLKGLITSLTIQGMPPGGNAGDHLVKNSAADFDAVWQPLGAMAADPILNFLHNSNFDFHYSLFIYQINGAATLICPRWKVAGTNKVTNDRLNWESFTDGATGTGYLRVTNPGSTGYWSRLGQTFETLESTRFIGKTLTLSARIKEGYGPVDYEFFVHVMTSGIDTDAYTMMFSPDDLLTGATSAVPSNWTTVYETFDLSTLGDFTQICFGIRFIFGSNNSEDPKFADVEWIFGTLGANYVEVDWKSQALVQEECDRCHKRWTLNNSGSNYDAMLPINMRATPVINNITLGTTPSWPDTTKDVLVITVAGSGANETIELDAEL